MGRLLLATLVLAGCAVDAPSSTVFLGDRGANQILAYDGTTGAFEGVFAGREQRVDRPAGLRLGPNGYLYMAGFGRGDVVRYDVTSGQMMGVFYWDTSLLEEPMDLVFRGDETLVLGNDTRNVVVLDATGRPTRELGWPTMRAALDLALAPDGRTLYVATETHPELGSAVQVWDVETGELVRHFGRYDELAMASSLVLRGDDLYVADWERGTVTRFDAATGRRLDVVTETRIAPTSLDFGPDGALYVLDAVGLHRLDDDALLIETGDGHNVRPMTFTFVVD